MSRASMPAWFIDALCAQTDPEAFFPDQGGSTRAAKKVCAVCPVKSQCLEWVLAADVSWDGVWGGTSERERRKMRPAFVCAECGAEFRLEQHQSRTYCPEHRDGQKEAA